MPMSILSVWVWGPKKALFKGASHTGAPFSPGSDILREMEPQRLGQSCGTSPFSGSAPEMGHSSLLPRMLGLAPSPAEKGPGKIL